MDDNTRVQIKSMINSHVVVKDNNLHIRREWNRKGQVQTLPLGIIRDLYYDVGFQAMLEEGILTIEDKDVRIELGMEAPGEEPTFKFYTENQMLAALVGSAADVKKAMNEMPKAQLNDFVNLAVQKEITDMAKVDVIKAKTGKDVIKMVQTERQAKEPVKTDTIDD